MASGHINVIVGIVLCCFNQYAFGQTFSFPSDIQYTRGCNTSDPDNLTLTGALEMDPEDFILFQPKVVIQKTMKLCEVDLTACSQTVNVTETTMCYCTKSVDNQFSFYVRVQPGTTESGFMLQAVIPGREAFGATTQTVDIGEIPAKEQNPVTVKGTYQIDDGDVNKLLPVQDLPVCSRDVTTFKICFENLVPGSKLKMVLDGQETYTLKSCIEMLKQFDFSLIPSHTMTVSYTEPNRKRCNDGFTFNINNCRKPQLENVTTIIPNMENVTTTRPTMENITTVTPKIENITTVTPNMENVTMIRPNFENVTKTNPNAVNVTTIRPNIENVTTIITNMENATTMIPKMENNTTLPPKVGNMSTTKPQLEDVTTNSPKNTSVPWLNSTVSTSEENTTAIVTPTQTTQTTQTPILPSNVCVRRQGSAPRELRQLNGMDVMCDTETGGGNWIVIQRRASQDVDFYVDWKHYDVGFGSLSGNFWFGLRKIYSLCGKVGCKLRVDLKFHAHSYFATYKYFKLGPAEDGYRFVVDGYDGDAGDALSFANGYRFSTKDKDNDGYPFRNCAVTHKGAWWYRGNACRKSNLNGIWGTYDKTGTNWLAVTGAYNSVSFSEMKIRPHTIV